MGNEFGGVSKSEAFSIGLASSMLNAFKTDADKRDADEKASKELDYEVLMRSVNDPHWIRTHTPSQRQMAMEKAIDLLKPKGHQDIKEKLKHIFAGGSEQPRQMQGANILRDVEAKPRANVTTEVVSGGTAPSVFANSGVTLPPPPSMSATRPEETFGEMELQDKERLIGAQLEKQLTAQTHADLLKNQQRMAQNAEIRARTRESLEMKSDAEAELAIKRQLTRMGIFDDSPENRVIAAESLHQEREQKKQLAGLRVEESRARIQKMKEDTELARTRIQQSAARLSLTQQKQLNDDPQVKGAWKKVDEYRNEAQRLRMMAATAYSKLDDEGATKLNAEAEKAEAAMQNVINNIEQRVNAMGVRLPNPPSGTRRGQAMLTEAEIRAASKSEAEAQAAIEEARRRGRLAQ